MGVGGGPEVGGKLKLAAPHAGRPVNYCSACGTKAEWLHGRKKVRSCDEAANTLGDYLLGQQRERFAAILLNNANAVLWEGVVAEGGKAFCPVDPSDILRPAILKGAAGIIIGHNHPSGSTLPSESDMELTKKLSIACSATGFKLLDHIIMADGEAYYSFMGRGALRLIEDEISRAFTQRRAK